VPRWTVSGADLHDNLADRALLDRDVRVGEPVERERVVLRMHRAATREPGVDVAARLDRGFLIATGGTAEAAVKLIEGAGGEMIECCFVIEVPELGGRQRLTALGHSMFALFAFEGG